MAQDRSFCPHCYAALIPKRKTCAKCGRNVSDAPPTSKAPAKQAASGSATIAVLVGLVVIIGVAAWVLLR
jgi:hypothetical protein